MGLSNGGDVIAALAAVNTTMAAGIGGFTAFTIGILMDNQGDIGLMCNGILAGLVAITAGCNCIHPLWTLLIGVVAGILVKLTSNFLKYLRIDDPLDAFAVHGVNGMWGVISVGLFANKIGGVSSADATYGAF